MWIAPDGRPLPKHTKRISEADMAIVRALQRTGSLTARELERITGIPRNTAWRRKRRLEADGVIVGYRAILAPGVSDDHVVLVEFRLELDERVAAASAELRRVKSIIQILRVGFCTYLLRVRGAAGVRELEHAVFAIGAPISRFEVLPVVDDVTPDL